MISFQDENLEIGFFERAIFAMFVVLYYSYLIIAKRAALAHTHIQLDYESKSAIIGEEYSIENIEKKCEEMDIKIAPKIIENYIYHQQKCNFKTVRSNENSKSGFQQ